MKAKFRELIYIFPVQLFLLHLKRHPILVVFWILLTMICADIFAKQYGAPYLFLSPEYMGRVTPLSYMILGFALGGFIMTWHTCFYMLNSFRFKFLVSLAKPFVSFTQNNFIIPLAFNIVYVANLIEFHQQQGTDTKTTWIFILSLMLGQLLMVLMVIFYFTLFNTNVENFIRGLTEKAKEKFEAGNIILDKMDPDRPILDKDQWPVETYLYNFVRIRHVRNVDHYDMTLIKKVLRQHHLNTLLIIFLCISLIFAYGILLDNPVFRIPAGAAILLIFSVLIAIACVISYWSGGWKVMVFIVIFVILNSISGFNLGVYKHKLLGLDYTHHRLIYSNQAIIEHLPEENIRYDIQESQKVLANWKKKFNLKDGRKPYMVFVQSSGGGSRAAFWGIHVLQNLEKHTKGKLMNHTMMMSGASGGMMGNAYFRQLYYLQKQGKDINLLDTIYREDLGKDLLNAIFSGYAANDLIFPWQTYQAYNQKYRKDRAFWFDNQLRENTRGLIDGKIMKFREAEYLSLIPMMVFSPTIMNDQRSLFISATPVSYLCLPFSGKNTGTLNYLLPDGVDFMRFFEYRGAENLDLATAMRLNATYPYVLPAAYLPTIPDMKVMDAGFRENHGFGASTKFVNVFRNWIEQNTAGIIFIQIRSDIKLQKMNDIKSESTLFNEMFLPFRSIYTNFLTQQDYTDDLFVAQLANSLKVPVHILPFIYTPEVENKEAAMSFHLTGKEKQDIVDAFYTEGNEKMMHKLIELLRVN